MHEESTEIFRPSKRPRVQRRRAAIEHDTYSDGENDRCRSPLEAESPLVEENEAPLSIADILRRRKDAQRRKGGLEFSLDATANPTSTSSTTLAATPKQAPRSPSEQIMTTRFAPQTGLVTEETDKHMMAYVDHEYAYRSTSAHEKLEKSFGCTSHGTFSDNQNPDLLTRNPASLGKLHEIDLGPSAKLQNIARTEAAISGSAPSPPPPKKLHRVRIGRNGKPYIPKPRPDRKRRNSADVARDQVVEAILRETKLEVYDEHLSEDALGNMADLRDIKQGAADDRLAEQFRREFLDAMNQRKEKANKMPGYGATGGKAGEEKAKGPKLGGSRSARAAMKEKQDAADRAAAAAKGRR